MYPRDGKSLVTLDANRIARVWDAATGKQIHQIGLEGDFFDRVALSSDGTTLATTEPDPDLRLRLWDLATGREKRRWHLRMDAVCSSPAFSPDGKTLVTIGGQLSETTKKWDPFIELWDVAAPGERRRRLVVSLASYVDLRISPDGKTMALLSTGLDEERSVQFSTICLLDLVAVRERAKIKLEGVHFQSMIFTPDGSSLVASLGDGTLRVYDPASGLERLPRLGQGSTNALERPRGATSRLWPTIAGPGS